VLKHSTRILVNDDKQDTTNLAHLFIPIQLYMFRAMFLTPVGSNIGGQY